MHSSCKNPIFFICLHLLTHCFLSSSCYSTTITTGNRRLLHQPLFPLGQSLPPTPQPQPPFPSPSPQPQPQLQPKYPFSYLSPPITPQTQNPFFPFYSSPPPPPPPPSSALVTFPANISSLILPRSSSSSNKPISHKLIAVIISVSILSVAVIAAVVGFFLLQHHRNRYYFHHHQPPTSSKADNIRLFPPNATPSDSTTTTKKPAPRPPPPPKLSRHTASSSSSEFLYLGTLVSSREVNYEANDVPRSPKNHASTIPSASASLHYHKLGSPELQPLPPLPRHQFQQDYTNPEMGSDDDEEYFSPRGSTGEKNSPEEGNEANSRTSFEAENARISSSNSYHYSHSHSQTHSLSSSPSILLNLSPKSSMRSVSPDSMANFPAPPLCIPPPPARERPGLPSSPPSSGDTKNSPSRVSDFSVINLESPMENLSFSDTFGAGGGGLMTPPPPPPPPPRFWETPVMNAGPPVLVAPSRPILGHNAGNGLSNAEAVEGRNENGVKPKLKPLHWDKVRASSDRAMVWDQLKSSSFQ